MKKNSWFGLLIVSMGMGNVGFAGIWGNWAAGGSSCNTANVQVIENGSSVSVLFDEFGINMPERVMGDGLSARKSCTFRIQLTPPQGYYLASFRQVYSGGIIKSAGSSAQLNIRYNIGSVVGRPLPITFYEGVTIRPQDTRSLFTASYNNNLAVLSCGGSAVYGLNMSFTGTRRTVNYDHLVGGLDSVDAEFQQRIVLIPEFILCPRS